MTGGRVVVMKGDEGLIASGGTTDYLFGLPADFHFPAVKADEVIADGHVVTLGGVSLTARHTPGHTPGTTTWTMTVEDGGRSYRVAFTGSTFVNPGTRLVKNPSYAGIEADYRRSFAMLESLPVDIVLGGPRAELRLPREARAREGRRPPRVRRPRRAAEGRRRVEGGVREVGGRRALTWTPSAGIPHGVRGVARLFIPASNTWPDRETYIARSTTSGRSPPTDSISTAARPEGSVPSPGDHAG